MGAGGSCLRAGGRQGVFTPAQDQALQQTVGELQAVPGGSLRVGVVAFKGLFRDAPETLPLFKLGDDWEHSPHFEHHCSIVMKTLIHIADVKVQGQQTKLEEVMDVMVCKYVVY
jgi:hypothetical protein